MVCDLLLCSTDEDQNYFRYFGYSSVTGPSVLSLHEPFISYLK